MSLRFEGWLTLVALAGLSSGCSMGVLPIPSSRVESAKRAEEPLLRGAGAPGAFKHAWDFSGGESYLFNPAEAVASGGLARLKGTGTRARHAVLVTISGAPFAALDAFSESVGPNHRGKILYQLSHNDSAWFYAREGKWQPAGPTPSQANTAAEVSSLIGTFHSEVGAGSLYLKIFLVSPGGSEAVELKEIAVQGILPRAD
ncbi:MAG: hypothetical protein NDJ89_04590 [Oligoflexia bacterium]|nr:hypothetical protein [Oligoflexia bacterium]